MARENYVGRAGQLAVMSEFLLRGYNVAIPEVDEGDDVLVVNDRAERVWRIQVKTAVGVERGYGFSGQFLVPLLQLADLGGTALYYVFALRCQSRWEFVPLSQRTLLREHQTFDAGSQVGESKLFYLAFKANELICSGRDWQPYRNNWNDWPVILS